MAEELKGKRVAFLIANEGVEQVEFVKPREAVEDDGAAVDVIAPKAEKIQAFNHLDKGNTFDVDKTVTDARSDDYDAVVLPGGVANPDQLRMDKDAVRFLREFFAAGKPVGAICHAPWILIEAEVVDGRQLTSWPSLQTDIRNAGGNWVDQECGRFGHGHVTWAAGHSGVQLEDHRGVRGGRARGAAREDPRRLSAAVVPSAVR